ncbi:MFS transporter [Fictibacillus sp. KIGAM418]|uniref:MFS transporter n=1 Tax=Fictibacillus marinisediminis TaxID=2878389 RepID=A0A9X1X8L4_9BACL|nr:MFS transporter [Fictibacillus marinisediminis]MCK6255949.1 MFS transporter [Fictibacillus marinisediminis]
MAEAIIKEEQPAIPVSFFSQKKFMLLWGVTFCSAFSIAIFLFSQSWYIVKTLNMEASLGMVMIASSIPRLLFMAVGGVIADRVSRTKILSVSNLTRSILLGGLLILLGSGEVSVYSFAVFGLVFGILDAFVWPANSALLPMLVEDSQLTRANSIIQTTQQASMIIGPMIGGFLVSWGGYLLSFSVPAVMLLCSAFLSRLINLKPASTDSSGAPGIFASIKEGFSFVKTQPFLIALFISTIFINLSVVGPLMMGLPIFVKTILHGSALDFSYMDGSMAAGMVVSSLVIGFLNVKRYRGMLATAALFSMAAALMLFSQTHFQAGCMAVLFLIGMTFPATNIPILSIFQQLVDRSMLGRLSGLLTMASLGLTPVSYAVTSFFLSNGVSITSIMFGGSCSLLLVNLIVLWKLPVFRKTS